MKKPRREERTRRAAAPAAPTAPAAATAAPAADRATESGLFERLIELFPRWVLVIVAVFALRRLDDFDTWWHLASGRWIAQNWSVPHTDVLSFTVPQNEWINLQWLYDLVLYGLWNIGGASGLVLSTTLCFVAAFALLARHLRMYVGSVATTLLLLWVAASVNERFLIRPEMASFPLFAAVQLVLAEGRGNPRRLKWLVPLMVLWVNMHSLFIVGIAAIACAIAGAVVAGIPILPANWRRDSAWDVPARRELFRWGGLALAATLLNPYLVRALLFPLELMSRIDGSSAVYSVIGEFRPPFSGYFPTFALGSYQAFVFTFVGLAIVAGIIRLFEPADPRERVRATGPRFDIGMLALAAALAWLSLLARRNVGIFVIGAAPFVGACMGVLLSRMPASWTSSSGIVVRAISVLIFVATLGVSATVVTNHWYAVTGETHEFGLGVLEGNFQTDAVAFFREQKLPGPVYNDMSAGGYLSFDHPTGDGVYVDGRLEVYDTPFFSSYLTNMGNVERWKKDADARGIQSVVMFHRWLNRHGLIRMLSATPEWRMVYYDNSSVIFVRATGRTELVNSARKAFQDIWRPRNEERLKGPAQTFPWQWSIGRYTGQLSYARVLDTLGDKQRSAAWFENAIATGLPPDFEADSRMRAAEYLANTGQLAQARVHLEKAIALDPADPDPRNMMRQLDAISR